MRRSLIDDPRRKVVDGQRFIRIIWGAAMGNDREISDNAPSCIRVLISITPGHEPRGDLVGLVGNFLFDLSAAAGLSQQTSSNANVQLIEKLTDVLERGMPLEHEMNVEYSIRDDNFTLDVRAPNARPASASTDGWFPADEPGLPAPMLNLKTMRRSKKELLAEMVREHRGDRAQGGLGLMRIQSDTRKRSGEDGRGGGGQGSPEPANAVIPFPKKP